MVTACSCIAANWRYRSAGKSVIFSQKNYRILRQILSIFFLLVATSLFAQTPAYLHYGVSDGLPSGLVYTIAQDSQGFLWFGTDKGLARFDGTRFRTFTMRDGLPDPEIINLFKDRQNRLWLSCFRKKIAYRKNGRLYTEKEDSLLAKMDIEGDAFDFLDDGNQGIWISCGFQKIYYLTPHALKSLNLPYSAKRIWNINGELFGLGRNAITKFDENGEFTPSYLFPDSYSPNKGTVAIATDGNRILYSFHERLLLLEYNGSQFVEVDSLSGLSATHAHVDRQGRFWVVSPLKGAFCFDHRKTGLQKPSIFLTGKKPSHILEDNEGTLWFATLNEGVYALPKDAVISYFQGDDPFLQSNNFTALATLSDGSLLVGDDSGNLFLRVGDQWKRIQLGTFDGYNRVRQILPLPDKGWLAVTDESIIFHDGSQPPEFEDLTYGSPKCAFYRNDSLWIGTSNQLFLYENSEEKVETLIPYRTMTLWADATGNIWAGGLNFLFSEKEKFSASEGKHFKTLSVRIVDIKSAGQDAIWVASPDYGLLKVQADEGKVTAVDLMNEQFPYPIENVQAIFTEPSGNVWLATNQGVFSFDKNLKISHFDENNALSNNDVNAVLVKGDTLWAATVSGLSMVLLRRSSMYPPFPTYIPSIRYQLGDSKIRLEMLDTLQDVKTFELPAGTSLLEVELAGLHYRTRGDISFEYVIQEELLPFFSLTWGNLIRRMRNGPDTLILETASRNFGVNIHPGRFLTKVTAILPNGIRSEQPAVYTFIILPFWWQTIWFSLTLAGCCGLGVWWVLRAKAAIQQLESAASELQLQALKAQINPHFIGNSINAIQQFFYPPDPVAASRYITTFSDLLRRTMLFSEKNFIPLREETAYIKDYLEMIALRFGDRFAFELQGLEDIPENTPFPAMLLQPILENATLHGLAPEGTSHLKIAFKMSGRRLTCSITDNGVGIESSRERKKELGSKRPSRGLSLLHKKVDTLNQLHPLDLKLEIKDVSRQTNGLEGTQAVITFLPDQIKSKDIQPTAESNPAFF